MDKVRDPLIVAIDGPGGAGKSTVAQRVARDLGFRLVDTGALYRAVALLAARAQVVPEDGAGLALVVAQLNAQFRFDESGYRVFLGDEEISESIRQPSISKAASAVARSEVVRAALLEMQQRCARAGNAVLEGRDIGTVVCPFAPFKFFLCAAEGERARRRYEELLARGESVSLQEVAKDLRERDEQDARRDLAPLKAAPDARILDTTYLSLEEVADRIVERVRRGKKAF